MHASLEEQVRTLTEEQTAAWNAGDGAAWARAFTHDASFVNIMGMELSGRTQVGVRHSLLLSTLFLGSRTEATLRQVTAIGADAAVARLDLAVTGYRALPPGITATEEGGVLRTRMLYLLARDADTGAWQIAAGQNTAIVPSALASTVPSPAQDVPGQLPSSAPEHERPRA